MATYWEVHSDAVASWALQESAGGTASDETGAHPSSLRGGLSFGNDAAPGPRPWLPSSLRFDGVDDYVSIPSPATMALGAEHSVSLWFRAESYQPWSDQALVELGGTLHATVLALQGNSLYLIAIHNGSEHVASVDLPDDGGWHHVVAVHQSTSVQIYLDGTLAHASNMTQQWVADGDHVGALGAVDGGRWVTGGDPNAIDAHLDGTLAGVMVFRKALTPLEIAELVAGPEPTLTGPLAMPAVIRAGDRIAVDGALWNGHQNGVLVTTTVLQASGDGIAGWTDQEHTRDQSSLIMPLALIGQTVRLASAASNDGGVAESSFGPPSVVLAARDPASLEVGSVRLPRCEVGATAISGCLVGIVLPQQKGSP